MLVTGEHVSCHRDTLRRRLYAVLPQYRCRIHLHAARIMSNVFKESIIRKNAQLAQAVPPDLRRAL